MLSKRGIEINSAKTRLDSDAQPKVYNRGLGAKLSPTGGWRFGRNASSRRRHCSLGAEPQALKSIRFFCKNHLILGLS